MKRSTASLPTGNSLTRSDNRVFFIALLGLILVFLVSLGFGSYPMNIFSPNADEMATKVFWTLRFPRVLAATLVGGVLGVTGAVCQTVFSNPLASPDITGVASGASFGAAAAILLGLGGMGRVGFAFVGGMLALGVLLLLVRLSGKAGTERRGRYLLAGIIVTSAANAGVMVLKTVADPERELAAIEFWTMGSFAAMTAQKLGVMALTSLPPLVLLLLFSRQALILSRGREEARSLGVSPALWQTLLLLFSTWSVAGVVSGVGVIGFVGLIVPHIALSLGGKRSRGFLPLCFLLGAILTVLADLLARTLADGAELPVGIFCVGFAVVWFVWLFCRRSGEGE